MHWNMINFSTQQMTKTTKIISAKMFTLATKMFTLPFQSHNDCFEDYDMRYVATWSQTPSITLTLLNKCLCIWWLEIPVPSSFLFPRVTFYIPKSSNIARVCTPQKPNPPPPPPWCQRIIPVFPLRFSTSQEADGKALANSLMYN